MADEGVFCGTAAELGALTRKHWGSGWWPKIIGNLDDSWRDIGAEATVSTIFAAAVCALPAFEMTADGEDWSVVVFDGGPWVAHTGPTRLHAVLAALAAIDAEADPNACTQCGTLVVMNKGTG